MSFEGSPHLEWGKRTEVDLPRSFSVPFKGLPPGLQTITAPPFKANQDPTGNFLMFVGPVGGVSGVGTALTDGTTGTVINFSQLQFTLINQGSTVQTVNAVSFSNPPTIPQTSTESWSITPSLAPSTTVTLKCGDSYRFTLGSTSTNGIEPPVQIDIKTSAGTVHFSVIYACGG